MRPTGRGEHHGRGLLVRLRAGLDAITEQMVEHYRREVSAYANLPPEVLEAEVRPVSRRNLEIFFSVVERGGGPLDEELEFLRASAAERARQGVPLTDLLHAYRAGTRIAWSAMLQEIDRGPAAERMLVGQLAGSLMTYLDRVSTVVEEAYLREWHGLMFRRAHGRWELATELLVAPDPGRAHVLAEAAGILLPDTVQIVALPAGRQAPPDADEGASGFLVELQGRSVFFLDPLGVSAFLPTIARRAGGPLGVSDPRPWLDGLGPAVSSACRVADLAVKMKLTGPVRADDLMVEQILAADPVASRRLFNSMLTPLIDRDSSGDLLRTLETYLETGCRIAEVARKLHVHPNTVAYRLDRIREVGGIDLGSADDRFGAHLAIRARRFHQLDNPD